MLNSELEQLRKQLTALSPSGRLNTVLSQLDLIQSITAGLVKSCKDVKLKRRLSVFHNRTSSLSGGLRTLDYTTTDLVKYRAKSLSSLRDIQESTTASKKKLGQLVSGEEDIETAVDRQSSDGKMAALFKDYDMTMSRYSSHSSLIRSLHSKNFILSKAPIVPMSNPPLIYDKLKDVGFEVGKIGGYAVLENQLVLGLNGAYLKLMREDLRKTDKQTAEMLKSQIEQKSKRKYEMIFGLTKGVGNWYWLLSESDLNRLNKTSFGGHVNITNWGFAFN